jgi:hypothetical protein
MKPLILLLVAALIICRGAAQELPSGTFILSDDDNYFGRVTVTREGQYTGVLRAASDGSQKGRRIFRGRLEFGGEDSGFFRCPQATGYVYPFSPSETMSFRHTPDGPADYALTVTVTIGSRIGPPAVYTYEIPSNRVLEDPSAAGDYTLHLTSVPGTGYGDPPTGTSHALVRLRESGRFRCRGRLPNGEGFSFAFTARADRKLDLFRYQSPKTFYPRRGGRLHSEFYGTITLRDVPGVSEVDGTIRWEAPAPQAREFATDVSVTGSR